MKKSTKRLETSHVVVESVQPTVDDGRFPAKATSGRPLVVSADVFSHGHEGVRAHLRWRASGSRLWHTVAMRPVGNDAFSAQLLTDRPGGYELEVLGEVDRLGNLRRDAARRVEAGRFDPDDAHHVGLLLTEAAQLLKFAGDVDGARLLGDLATDALAARSAKRFGNVLTRLAAVEDELRAVPPTALEGVSPRYNLHVAPPLAAFSSWYECFPRSASPTPGRHGTLRDVIARLDYVGALGFDVLYLPPVHPIGTVARKGKNNAAHAGRDDVGSPWAIGSAAGGHSAIAPELGTIEDFDELVGSARDRGIEIALDLAFQCAPDHPWVSEHPEWFLRRPDGTIACAENPPKRYEDIYPLDFDSSDREGLYAALLGVVRHWIGHGVRVFRVDNPHTKPFAFWERLLGDVRASDPETIFLSEAFTRPKVMHRLAKLGFDQSYTYFTWRDTKPELIGYFEELAHGPGAAYLRPNVWPNTPDICARSLQFGGRPSFVSRLVLAAGLSANYGIYGPAFELLVDKPAHLGTDGDYADSEKFEVHSWDLDDPKSIADVIARVNAARHAHHALQQNATLRFHAIDNDQILCWSKRDEATGDSVVCVVSLDPRWPQSGFVELDLEALGIASGAAFTVRDELDGASYRWVGARNFVLLDPARSPAHLFALQRAPGSGTT